MIRNGFQWKGAPRAYGGTRPCIIACPLELAWFERIFAALASMAGRARCFLPNRPQKCYRSTPFENSAPAICPPQPMDQKLP